MFEALSFLLLLGLAASVILAIASRVFYVWEDPKVLAIADVLPGANCGGCGNAGCGAAAEAIASGRAAPNVCVVGGLETAQAVGKILGRAVEAKEPEFHWTSCLYGVGEADPRYTYNGAEDCRAAVALYGGSKLCPIGCIGLGSCVKSCQFDALHMGENHLPVVDLQKCVGCGACVAACPKGIIALTSATRRVTSEYVTDECTAPCQRACPTGISIRDYIYEIRGGHYEEALRIIKEKCPLPLVCGHICPAPCELNCRRNLVDEPVAINALKRFAADHERTTGRHVHPYKAPSNGKRIAMVGGGAEGLTAAYYLARLGFAPTILEAKPELGGILRYVISEDRLPRPILDHDIRGILDIGVEVKTGKVLGRDFTVPALLQEGYDAVALTSGGLDSRKILHPDQRVYASPVPGFILAIDFLTLVAGGQAVTLGKRVLIFGAGPGCLPLARRCRELGAQEIFIVTNASKEHLPPELQETRLLRSEGVHVHASACIAAIGGMGERITRVALEGTALRPGGPERTFLEVDALVAAEPRFPELVFVSAGPPSGDTPWQTVETFRTFPDTRGLGIFSAPEPARISDSSAVVKSILSGRRLARAIQQHFTAGLIAPIGRLASEAARILDVSGISNVAPAERQRPPSVDVEADSKTAWILPRELPGLDEGAARKEAERCLRCGLICYLKTARETSAEGTRAAL
jgi:NADPH-dependent glutamate synthase beta subunit-like oxidoreductase